MLNPDLKGILNQGISRYSLVTATAKRAREIAIENLGRFMLKHTNYTQEEIEQNIVGEWFVRKDEALAKGVIDEIINDISILM